MARQRSQEMNKVLVTFLGRGRLGPHHSSDGPGYLTANYRFPDGSRAKSAFFGLELAKYLDADELLILGTKGSQWAVLVEGVLEKSQQQEEMRIKLLDAEQQSNVGTELLEQAVPVMSYAVGRTVRPYLIPFGRDTEEQVQILKVVADAVQEGQVHIDLTHGFRHLGVTGFLSASMLQRLPAGRNRIHVEDIWYGALDMKEQDVAPVLRLGGIERVHRWTSALDRYDATGDYAAFVELLEEDGVPKDKTQHLRDASFHERTLNIPDAIDKLQLFLPVLKGSRLRGASALFQDSLKNRLKWIEGKNLAQRQYWLAFEYLKRKDFVRAAIFGYEAWLSWECQQRDLPLDQHECGRKEAKEKFMAEIKNGHCSPAKASAWYMLNTLRNALAHGNPPKAKYRKVLRDPNRLKQEIKKSINLLVPQEWTQFQ